MRLSVRQFNDLLNRLIPLFTGGIVLLTTCLVLYVRFRAVYLAHPNLGGVEHNVIYSVLRLMNGYPLYENPAVYPYSITQYGPIYYNVVAWIAKLAHVSPGDSYSVYVVSRWVSLGANLLMVLGIIQLARQLKLPLSIAVLVGLLLFAWIPVHAYSRPDSFCNALAVWVIYSLVRWRCFGNTPNWYPLLAACLTALALFTKQSALCLPVIITGYGLFVAQDWRNTAIYCISLAFFLILNYVVWVRVDVGIFGDNVIRGISNGIDLANFKRNIVRYYIIPYSWLIILGIAISRSQWRRGNELRRILGASAIGFFLFAVVTSLKQGSAFNYFSEFTAIALLLAVDAGWHYWKTRPTPSIWSLLTVYALVAICIPFHAANFNWKLILGKPNDTRLYRDDLATAKYLTDSLHLTPSDQIHTTFYHGSFLSTLLFKNIILPQQDIVREASYPRQTYDYAALNASLRNGAIRYVIASNTKQDVFFSALKPTMYKPRKRIGNYTIYEAKSMSIAGKGTFQH